jgi:hypothetical protein
VRPWSLCLVQDTSRSLEQWGRRCEAASLCLSGLYTRTKQQENMAVLIGGSLLFFLSLGRYFGSIVLLRGCPYLSAMRADVQVESTLVPGRTSRYETLLRRLARCLCILSLLTTPNPFEHNLSPVAHSLLSSPSTSSHSPHSPDSHHSAPQACSSR